MRDVFAEHHDDQFKLISIHFPEFGYQRDNARIAAEVERLGVNYPVAIDNDKLIWDAYKNRGWPAFYGIDRSGEIRYQHIGKNDFGRVNAVIRQLKAT